MFAEISGQEDRQEIQEERLEISGQERQEISRQERLEISGQERQEIGEGRQEERQETHRGLSRYGAVSVSQPRLIITSASKVKVCWIPSNTYHDK